jgi:hypothetical protein
MALTSEIYMSDNPIDSAEHIFHRRDWGCERRGKDEVVLEVEGKWGNLLFFLAWEEHLRCLHLSCLMNIETKTEDRAKIFELLALINENLWIGHFSYWTEQRMPLFKHSIILNASETDFENKLEQLICIAVNECEQAYPLFTAVLKQGILPSQIIRPDHGLLQ